MFGQESTNISSNNNQQEATKHTRGKVEQDSESESVAGQSHGADHAIEQTANEPDNTCDTPNNTGKARTTTAVQKTVVCDRPTTRSPTKRAAAQQSCSEESKSQAKARTPRSTRADTNTNVEELGISPMLITARAGTAGAGTVAEAKTSGDSRARAKATRQAKREQKLYCLLLHSSCRPTPTYLRSEVSCAGFTGRLSDVLVAAIRLFSAV